MKRILKSILRHFGYEITQATAPDGHIVFREPVEREHDPLRLKHFANRVAELSMSGDAAQAVRLLHLTGVMKEQAPVEISRIEVGSESTLQIGIWRRSGTDKDAPFARIQGGDAFDWANREMIAPKCSKWRVLLVGESVARGFLYDPDFTPASALEEILRSNLGTADVEVIDLAKSSMAMQPLEELIGQSLALLPDAIVIFAGNNWHLHLKDSDIPVAASLLRAEGAPGVKSFIDATTGHAVKRLVRHVNALVDGRNISLIWVIPEFNLDDWHDPVANAPLLPGCRNRQWRNLDERARAALAQGDLIQAARLAQEMVDLDGGTNAVALRILAECRRANGDVEGARHYLEMCRDAEGWDPSFAYSPRTSATIQSALRESGSLPNNKIVDLPSIFRAHLNGDLPNRRLFLDYCHLTAEGIGVAMAAVGSKVLESLTGRVVTPEKLRGKFSPPPPEVEGKACLFAGIHNAHYFQASDLTRYWCARALQYWPEGADIMTRFIDFQTRRMPMLACRSAIELHGRRELVALLRGGTKRLDLALIDAMTACLREYNMNVPQDISVLRKEEHAVGTGPKELTDFYYSSTMLTPSERAWTSKSFSTNRGTHCIYTSAFWRQSKFVFVAEKGRAVGLKCTYRVPEPPCAGAKVDIAVNGHLVAGVPAESTWQTLHVSILGEEIIDGLNKIVITWPDDHECSNPALNRAADALVAGRVPHLYLIYGEIHSLLAYDPLESAIQPNATESAEMKGIAAVLAGTNGVDELAMNAEVTKGTDH